MMIPAVLAAAVGLAAVSVNAAFYEPPAGKAYLAFWVDTQNFNSVSAPYSQGDTPSQLNTRLGLNAGGFQLSQSIPVGIIPDSGGYQNTVNLTMVEATGTDAILFMTVYPTEAGGFAAVQQSDVTALATQLNAITTKSMRRVLLRLCPEMNGNWYPSYQSRPLAFIAFWQMIYNAVKASGARVDFVWSPNLGAGYPYGTPVTCNQNNATLFNQTECSMLDTNHDNVVDLNDDPYTPYYPGDAFVDWVALSIYWKGGMAAPVPPTSNVPIPNGVSAFEDYMLGTGTSIAITPGQTSTYNFYQMFAVGHQKPMAISESAAAFGISDTSASGTTNQFTGGPTRVQMLQPYWQEYVTNATFFKTYPQIKFINLFEWEKPESDDNHPQPGQVLRDFRVTFDPAVLSAFQSDLKAFNAANNIYFWGNVSTPGSSGSGSSGSSGGSGSGGSPGTLTNGGGSGGAGATATVTTKSGAQGSASTFSLVGSIVIAAIVMAQFAGL